MEVKAGQTFYDMVIEGTGSIDNSFAMSLKNLKSQTDELETLEKVEPSGRIYAAVTELFIDYQPATAVTENDEQPIEPINGIGSMTIEQDFIVS